MNMTPAAIVRDYEETKDKRAQIQILADMNLCEKKEIEKILSQNGCELPPKPKRKNKENTEEPKLPENTGPQGQDNTEGVHKNPQAAGTEKASCQVPGIVRELVNAKMVWLQQAIDVYQERIKRHEKDLEELSAFLKRCK